MYKKSSLVCVIAGALAAISLSMAQDAHADEASFLQAVASDGMPAGSTALALGHQICTDIVSNGVNGVDSEIRMGLTVGMSSTDVANIVADAVTELCPSGIPAVKAWAAQNTTRA
jgi:hypothetical protein